MEGKLTFALLNKKNIPEILFLAKQLNPKLTSFKIKSYLKEMFQFPNYHCFGLYIDKNLVGISSAWITIRIYSGKQLEVDNLVIDKTLRSKGLGRRFFEFIEDWALKNACKTIELNTYVDNPKSHKFYFNLGCSILGFHFMKNIGKS